MCFVGASQNTFVPDDNFEQALIDLGYDSGPLDDYVPTGNIVGVTNLDIQNLSISDLTGIEDFVALTALDCSDNNLTDIDVTKNTALMILWFSNNLVSSIDVTKNVNLISLVCSYNLISNLNLSLNPSLNVLVCENNQLSALDVTKNTNLSILTCENNQIKSLDLSNNDNLSSLNCSFNFLSELDVSNKPKLLNLFCDNNLLTELDFSNTISLTILNCGFNQLSELDISKNPYLTTVVCNDNNLCRLNLNNGNNLLLDIYFISNPNLNCVVVDNPFDDHSRWIPTNFSNYVSSQNNCSNFVNVDSLDNVITNSSYSLPTITYGNYYTESGGNGTILNAGDIITTSQTIYIFNDTGCYTNESSFNVVITQDTYYIPKFFTPNNDGSHDTWQVLDNSNTIQTIYIYNRYGKLLKSIAPNGEGWNGTFNGQAMESNDYWYAITLNTGETIKGHFTLKR